jgi:tRNA pseudouridine32 synthase/23S rRNA pseudouridine746 synthase
MDNFILKKEVVEDEILTIADFLTRHTGLSKTKIKDAMKKGAVWKKTGKGKRKRIRHATTVSQRGDILEIYFDENLLSQIPPVGKMVEDSHHYSIWYKPDGLMAQGNNFGDHCSLIRQAEIFFHNRRKVYPVHRLDREASGLMILAHSKDSAKQLSCLFRERKIIKQYIVSVLGAFGAEKSKGEIRIPLDGREALTEYTVKEYNRGTNTTTVHVMLKTGRKHQIRRHFDLAGFPVMGDPRYGKGNKNTEGLQLRAVKLEFRCPYDNKRKVFSLE